VAGRVGVLGRRGSDWSCMISSRGDIGSKGISGAIATSADLLLESRRDVLWRFLAECSLSSEGCGRVEQGSEETARSCDSSTGSRSICEVDQME
jgi:hypothetical protein